MPKRAVLLTILLLALASSAAPHGGGLDRDGCHTNRKTGDYHCHRGSVRNTPRPEGRTPKPSPRTPQPLFDTRAGAIRFEHAAISMTEVELLTSIQILLEILGYQPGLVDGKQHRETREAITRFQADHQMKIDGQPSGRLLVRLTRATRQQTSACSS